jgi:hypothetical protein
MIISHTQSTVKPVLRGHLIRHVTSFKMYNSYETFYDRVIKIWPFSFDTVDCLIEVIAWAVWLLFLKDFIEKLRPVWWNISIHIIQYNI